MARELRIFCDGASRGNPGLAAAGAVLYELPGGSPAGKVSLRLGITTNNVAEYAALLLALQEARKLGASKVGIFADSQLLVRQLQGQYRVKNPALQRLHGKALQLLAGFESWQASHVPREQNKVADQLANQALDRPEESGLMEWEELL